ncbi:MAG TPA: hypothetical protein VLD13_12835 [Gaiellaceae bacterium]|nr:hypothetical protein [Gaiellaceae bacterium]
MATLHERQTEQRGLGSPSRTRWLVLIGVAAAVIAVIVLVAVLSSGGGGAPGY